MRLPILLRALLLLTAALCGVHPAEACSCFGTQPACTIHLGTTEIFRGIVIERTLEVQTMKFLPGDAPVAMGSGRYKVRLAVRETFSGKPAQEQVVYTDAQGSMCGFNFEVGTEYLVFTYDNQRDNQLWTSRCSKTHNVDNPNEDADILWMRGLPSAPPGVRIYGTVRLVKSGPVEGAKVHVQGAATRDVASDDKGLYEVKGLPAGDYTVTAILPAGFAAVPERRITVGDKECAQVDWYATYDSHVRQVK